MRVSEEEGVRSYRRVPRRLAIVLSTLLLSCATQPGTDAGEARGRGGRAEEQLAVYEDQLSTADRSERAALEAQLWRFIGENGTDPVVGRARLLLGRHLLWDGDEEGALRAVEPLLSGAPGPLRDDATLVLAGVETRKGHPERALVLLEPLSGKLFSVPSRTMHADETLEAALLSHRYRLVLSAIVTRSLVRRPPGMSFEAWMDQVLGEIPSSALASLTLDAPPQGVSEETLKMRALVEERIVLRLTREAVENGDSRLARDVLVRTPAALRGTADYERLKQLVLLLEDEARVEGYKLGVVLGGASPLSVTRTVQLLSGAFDGQRGEGKGSVPYSILSEEDGGALANALSRLASEGASLLVAGVDEEGAKEAVRFANERRVPVLVPYEPVATDPGEFAFFLGVSAVKMEETLTRAASELGFSSVFRAEPGDCAAWPEGLRPEAVLVLGAADCSSQMAAYALRQSSRPKFFLGLDASAEAIPAGLHVYQLRAHRFPDFSERTGLSAESFFAELGRDAAALAAATFAKVPRDSLREREAVLARYELVRDSMSRAETALRTTARRGFAGAHRLERVVVVEEREKNRGSKE